MKQLKLKRICTLLRCITLVYFVLPLTAHAVSQKRDYQQILDQPLRPTIAEILEVEIPDINGIPSPPNGRIDYQHWLNTLLDGAPLLIAQLERAFPGATWAFIGRDTYLIADVFEAFYLSIGQQDRVRRLGISKPTFWQVTTVNNQTMIGVNNQTMIGKLKVDQDQLVNFLKAHGWQLPAVKAKGKSPVHPFILIDTLSRGAGRQGRVLLEAGYRHALQQNLPAEQLVRLFNMIGLSTSTYNGSTNYQQLEQVLNETEKSYRQFEHGINTQNFPRELEKGVFYSNHPFIKIPQAQDYFHESGYEHFTGAWHEHFGPFKQNKGETIEATSGQLNPVNERQSILWMQRQIIKEVFTDEFKKQVLTEANELGFEFPLNRPSAVDNTQPIDGTKQELLKRLKANDEKIENVARTISRGPYQSLLRVYLLNETLKQLLDNEASYNIPNGPFMSSQGLALFNWLEQGLKQASNVDMFPAYVAQLGLDALVNHPKQFSFFDKRNNLQKILTMTPATTKLAKAVSQLVDSDSQLQKLFTENNTELASNNSLAEETLKDIQQYVTTVVVPNNCKNQFK